MEAGIEAANVEQARAWDGEEGEHWVEFDDHYTAAVSRHDAWLQDADGIGANELILDIGCGCGASTRQAARRASSGSALGVDLSSQMIERARQLAVAEGLTNVSFEQADAQTHRFDPAGFDVAISRFGAMFFADPVAAFANVASALRPDGRVALLAWRELADNEWLVALRTALGAGRALPEPPAGAPGPFGLADPKQVEEILTSAGFGAVECSVVDEPIRLGDDVEDSERFLGGLGLVRGLLDGLDEATAAGALDRLRATIAAHDTGDGVWFGSSAWLITARRG